MEIPPALKSQIENGRAILFLGAGASKGAKNSKGEEPPLAKELSKNLADTFLGGQHNDKDLAVIAELSICESNINDVQNHIANILSDFKPAPFHLLVPKFQWRAIFTLNYDRIIEDAYVNATDALQKAVVIRSNADVLDGVLRKKENVPLVKLHGCITRTTDANLPLILTLDQFATYSKNRNRLYQHLLEWGNEYPIIFAGFGMHDSDLRLVLSQLNELGDARPMFYFVTRTVSDIENRFWASKRITVLKGSFEDFLTAIEIQISSQKKLLLSQVAPNHINHPIESRFIKAEPLNGLCSDFLTYDAEYVDTNILVGDENPKDFFKGFDFGWYGIQKDLAAKRVLADKMLNDSILCSEEDRPTKTDFYLIKGPGGAGKSVLLRQLAWQTATEGKLLSLYLRKGGKINYLAIKELCRLTKERIFIFIDDASGYIGEIQELVKKSRVDNLLVTIVSTERSNEWNVKCEELNPFVSQFYTLEPLVRSEIVELINILEKNDSLGHLKSLSLDDRIKLFTKEAGRQLLVALHEATQGKPFEEIVFDEYSQVSPVLAQSIYLTVCSLNRFKIPVRAGLISRLYNIPFTEFKNKFFAPLEHLIRMEDNVFVGDMVYQARHSEIARMVFDSALSDPEMRFHEYIKILSGLNISYGTDLQAFRRLIHGKTLLSNFSDHQAIKEIFEVAFNIGENDPYVLQQYAIYEMRRPNGNFDTAHKYLVQARGLDREDTSVMHSIAELAYSRSEKASSLTEKEKFRKEAESIAIQLLEDRGSKKHARHTLIKIQVGRLEDLLSDETATDGEIDEAIYSTEQYFAKSQIEDPDDTVILQAESGFRELIKNKQKALQALEKAYQINKRDAHIASRLAKYYESIADLPRAIEIISDALDNNSNNHKLRYQMAMLLKAKGDADVDTMLYHLRRSFTPSDRNAYDPRFWYAFYAFISGDNDKKSESKTIFSLLREAYIPFEVKNKIRVYWIENGSEKIFAGSMSRKEDSYGFVIRDGLGDDIFVHRNHVSENMWSLLSIGKRISFKIGFNFSGPVAVDINV